MKTYKVNVLSVNFHSGTLRLSDEQYKSRSHALEATKVKGEYRILKSVQFKRGEEIGYDGEVGKAQAADLVPVEEKRGPGRPPKE